MADFTLDQDEALFEQLIQGLIQDQVGCCDNFLPPQVITGLRENLLGYHQAGLMHPAGTGRKFNYQQNTLIRGDVIRWLDEDGKDPFEQLFFEKISKLTTYLNHSCYAGLHSWEFHYAYYEQYSFYKRHRDQFQSDRKRKYSMVIYLNSDWKESDGGRLELFLGPEESREVYPIGGRAVFFQSDRTEHEVHPSYNRYRISIAGWLKSL